MTPEDIMRTYNFVGVTERFDESLLLLGKYLQINMVDLLYLKAKQSGHVATDQCEIGRKQAKHPPFHAEPSVVQVVGNSIFNNSRDMRLLELANEALNAAAIEYGPSFADDYKAFSEQLRIVEGVCRPHFFRGCFWNDNGCGQYCIDKLTKLDGWWKG